MTILYDITKKPPGTKCRFKIYYKYLYINMLLVPNKAGT